MHRSLSAAEAKARSADALRLGEGGDPVVITLGYPGSEAFSRAFKRRFGQRPPVYREFRGRLSPEAVHETEVEPRR